MVIGQKNVSTSKRNWNQVWGRNWENMSIHIFTETSKNVFDDESKNVLEKVCICVFSSADIDPNKQKGKLSFYRQSSICSIIVHLRIM